MLKKLILILLLPFLLATSYDFNGTTSRVEVAHHGTFSSAILTTGCWVYREGLGEAGVGRMLAHLLGSSGYEFYVLDASNMRFEVQFSTTDGSWDVSLPTLNTWVHVVIAYDSGSVLNDPDIYFNGVLQSETETQTPVGTRNTAVTPFIIGAMDNTGLRVWDGKLADCFYESRKLEINEVNQIMRFGPLTLDTFSTYWPLGLFGGSNLTPNAIILTADTDTAVSNIGPPRSTQQGTGFLGW